MKCVLQLISSCSSSLIHVFTFNLQANLTVTSDVTTSKAEYVNSETVVCTFPGEGLYQVAVSNNGQTTSLYQVYIIYNSYCYSCSETGCTRRVRFWVSIYQILFFKLSFKDSKLLMLEICFVFWKWDVVINFLFCRLIVNIFCVSFAC